VKSPADQTVSPRVVVNNWHERRIAGACLLTVLRPGIKQFRTVDTRHKAKERPGWTCVHGRTEEAPAQTPRNIMAKQPSSRPQILKEELDRILTHRKVKKSYRAVLIGIRGYYLDSMGEPGKNDRGEYDDAIFLVRRDEAGKVELVFRYNANTDPSKGRKGMANLEPGSWLYHVGLHRGQYTALRQKAPVTVKRDEEGNDTGWFGINIHKGGWKSTSSEGCQTIVPAQWNEFILRVQAEMKRAGQKVIPYELINETDRRKHIEGQL
jgi:hypothetical protein